MDAIALKSLHIPAVCEAPSLDPSLALTMHNLCPGVLPNLEALRVLVEQVTGLVVKQYSEGPVAQNQPPSAWFFIPVTWTSWESISERSC